MYWDARLECRLTLSGRIGSVPCILGDRPRVSLFVLSSLVAVFIFLPKLVPFLEFRIQPRGGDCRRIAASAIPHTAPHWNRVELDPLVKGESDETAQGFCGGRGSVRDHCVGRIGRRAAEAALHLRLRPAKEHGIASASRAR